MSEVLAIQNLVLVESLRELQAKLEPVVVNDSWPTYGCDTVEQATSLPSPQPVEVVEIVEDIAPSAADYVEQASAIALPQPIEFEAIEVEAQPVGVVEIAPSVTDYVEQASAIAFPQPIEFEAIEVEAQPVEDVEIAASATDYVEQASAFALPQPIEVEAIEVEAQPVEVVEIAPSVADYVEQANVLVMPEAIEVEAQPVEVVDIAPSVADYVEQANVLVMPEAIEVEAQPVEVVEIAPSVADYVEQANVLVMPEAIEVEAQPVEVVEIAPSIADYVEQANVLVMPEAIEVEAQPVQVVPQSLRGSRAEQEQQSQTSFLRFYGLREQPFGVSPDPAYLYLGQDHREALASLVRGIQNDRGFMTLIAEPGMGKTTLLNKLMAELGDSARTVFLFQTQCGSREFFRYLLSELGVASAGMDPVSIHNKLNEILFQEMLQGKRFVLIVDEAQNLHESVLETVRLLSDFEANHAKLLQIVLAGQPQLADKLTRPSLSQLRQRIAVLARLEPLSAAETARYIEHRFQVASESGEHCFTPDALAFIAELSQGIPRNINNICFNALMLGYSRGRKTIDSDLVQEAGGKLDLESLVRRPPQTKPAPEPACAVVVDNPPQITAQPIACLAPQGQPDRVYSEGAKSVARTTVNLEGKLSELVPTGRWGKDREFRMLVSLERNPCLGISVGERYYCFSLYVSEEEAKTLRAGQTIRIAIEQD